MPKTKKIKVDVPGAQVLLIDGVPYPIVDGEAEVPANESTPSSSQ